MYVERTVFCIVTAQGRDDANATLEAMGWGPTNFSQPARPIGSSEADRANATHWYGNYANTPEKEFNEWVGLSTGQLPDLKHVEWGEEGHISADRAKVSHLPDRVVLAIMVHSHKELNHVAHANGVLASLGLEMFPNPEF